MRKVRFSRSYKWMLLVVALFAICKINIRLKKMWFVVTMKMTMTITKNNGRDMIHVPSVHSI